MPEEPRVLAAPKGFVPQGRPSPFLAPFEPIYSRREPDGSITLGLYLGPAHLNERGLPHGGLLTTLADSAMARSLAALADPPQRVVTVSLSIDFYRPAHEGDWLEVRVNHTRSGSRLCFASCLLVVGDEPVARANGIFAVMARPRT